MFTKLKIQIEVLSALAIRDMQGRMKTSRYGYVWLFVEPLFYVLVFRMIVKRGGGGSGLVAGMTPLMYGFTGILPLYCCLAAIKSYTGLAKTSPLQAFPRVTAADVAIASGLSDFSIYFFLFWVVALPVSIYENSWPPQNIVKINLALIGSWILGTAAAFALSGLYRVFPGIRAMMSYLTWGLRMISGFLFCIVQVPLQYWPYLTWNPLLHLTEMVRDGWFESYVSPIASPAFVVECILGLVLLGLSVERLMRRLPET